MNLENLTEHLNNGTNRRQALKRLGWGAAGLAGLNLLSSRAGAQEQNGSAGLSDVTILQFALNLEYLEAQYYTYATTGHGIEQEGIPTTGKGMRGPVLIDPNPKVNFSGEDEIRQYAFEIAADERDHVLFLRKTIQALGATPIAQPTLDLDNSFDALARAAGLGNSFDPFANAINFALGAFIFEDVGVTAYRGAAPLIDNKQVLSGAAGLLGTEAYHASNIRTTLYVEEPHSFIVQATKKISDLRDVLDQDGDEDQPIVLNGSANIVPTDNNGLVFARTVRQILNIVYGAVNASKGLFFPNGINL